MLGKILVVCVGNICRSPTGERLLMKYSPTSSITSAGISAVVGHAADIKAEKIAKENSLSLNGHVAKQLTAEMCTKNELILVMEQEHFDAVCRIAPEARGKIMLYGHWLGKREIPDPYRKSEEIFRFVYQLLDSAALKWAQALKR
ncbi:protein tyrosine phosphatase [Sodalis sp. RH19]|uniref:arsenate reductase/protein-tyrosine-phosphatase family protein n=1 Tax=Sodalis sp. RH19 TaxID=3394334 RepID=UPI0039B5005B